MNLSRSEQTRCGTCMQNSISFFLYRAKVYTRIRILLTKLFFLISIPLTFCICGYPEKYSSDASSESDIMQGIEIIPRQIIIEKDIETPLNVLCINANGSKSAISSKACTFIVIRGPAIVDQTGIISSSSEGTGSIQATYGPFSSCAEYTVILRPDYKSLRISEVMYDPEPETGREYIEIYNCSDSPCDLNGVSLIDSNLSSTPFVIHDLTIRPRNCVVIAQSSDLFSTTYGREPDGFPFTFTLANTGDSVFLIDPDGTVIDSLYIRTGGNGIVIPALWGTEIFSHNGYSLARIDPDTDTDRSSDFLEQGPSPGYIIR
jgi:hypothetical protein